MKKVRSLLLLSLLFCGAGPTFGEDEQANKRWKQILGPSTGTIPTDPGGKVNWRTDFQAALKEEIIYTVKGGTQFKYDLPEE